MLLSRYLTVESVESDLVIPEESRCWSKSSGSSSTIFISSGWIALFGGLSQPKTYLSWCVGSTAETCKKHSRVGDSKSLFAPATFIVVDSILRCLRPSCKGLATAKAHWYLLLGV